MRINANTLRKELPAYQNPPSMSSGELNSNLLKHQLQALQWCYEREYPVLPKKEEDKAVQFWTLKKRNDMVRLIGLKLCGIDADGILWVCRNIILTVSRRICVYCVGDKTDSSSFIQDATNTPQRLESPPVLGKGGLMGDAMGLGTS